MTHFFYIFVSPVWWRRPERSKSTSSTSEPFNGLYSTYGIIKKDLLKGFPKSQRLLYQG